MKRFALAAALMTLCAVAVCYTPDIASALHDPAATAGHLLRDTILANPLLVGGLAAARTRHADLVRQATAKLAEVKDGQPADQVRAIETAHADLVRQATELNAAIVAEEARQAPVAPNNPNPPVPVAPTAEQLRAAAEAAATAERQRFADIRAACEAVNLGSLAADMFGRNLTIDQARAELLVKLAEQSRQNPTRPQITITQDEGDTIRRAVESAIVLRANPSGLPANDPNRELARNWRGMSLLEMGRTFLEETQGRRLRGLGKFELATAVLGLDTLRGRAAGMQSTSDFAVLLANVAAKRLRAAYAAAPQIWKRLARQSNNPDFKAKSVVQLSSAPSFKKVVEGGEFTYGALTDGAESYALATYGRIIAITRQALINDDLGAFDRIPAMMGRAAAELEATTFWAVITANAAMSDGKALFHADHGNLSGSGHAIDETGMTAARKAMRTQRSLADKSADREYLSLTPRWLVSSPDKEIEALKFLTAVLASATEDVNVFAGTVEPLVEPRLSGNAWYLFADPQTIDTIEYAYLEGEEGLFTEERVGFEVDGIEIKGRVDFAAKAIDWRGIYKDIGA